MLLAYSEILFHSCFFRFDEEVNIGKLDIKALLEDLRAKHLDEYDSYTLGEPLFASAEEVLRFREGFV